MPLGCVFIANYCRKQMLPRTNKRERSKKGIIYMCWTHVWMRDGILPLNRECLGTTNTVKTRVSQVGQAAFLFSSQMLLMPHPSKCHLHCFPHWVRFNCLVLLDNPWHGTERSLSGYPCTPASREPQVPLPELWCSRPSGALFSPALSARSRAEATEGVKEHRAWPVTPRHLGRCWCQSSKVRRGQALISSSWLHVCAGPCPSQLWDTLSDSHRHLMGHLMEFMPRLPCQWVAEPVCWWQPVLQCLGTGPAGQFGDRSIMETPSTVGGLSFHNKPDILSPNPATLHHRSNARDVVSGIISGSTGVRCGGKKAHEWGGIWWHAWHQLAQYFVSSVVLFNCLQWPTKKNYREFMIFYYVWKEWHVRKKLMCLCLDRQESRRTNYNINICSGRIINRNRAD